MRKVVNKRVQMEDVDMRDKYDFREGVRGKHYKDLQAGYTITIHQADGTTTVKHVRPREGTVVLDPDIQPYFPDSESVNKTLRCLIPMLPKKRGTKRRKRTNSVKTTPPYGN